MGLIPQAYKAEIYAVIAAVALALVGYSYYWTYDQGRKNGATSELAKQVKVQAKALADQEAEFRRTRAKEMDDARKAADDFAKYHKRMVVLYEKALDNIKKLPVEDQVCLARPVDDDYVGMRNAARSGSPPET